MGGEEANNGLDTSLPLSLLDFSVLGEEGVGLRLLKKICQN